MFKATTILSVRRGDSVAIGGDGQVTLGNTVVKHKANKIRKLYDDKVIVGFAGSAADSFALLERFSAKLEQFQGNILKGALELAKDWRTDRVLRKLESLLAVVDKKYSLLVSGTGDVIEPDDGIIGIGSGGPYAIAAAKSLMIHTDLPAKKVVEEALKISAEICIYTNDNIHVEEIFVKHLTPKKIVEELDKYIVSQKDAKRSVAIAIRNRWRREQLSEDLREEVLPKNIIMIGPTGVGKTEIARRLATLVNAPFLKVEASKYTEVGYHGRDVESMIRDIVEISVNMVKTEKMEEVKQKAEKMTEERLLDLLLPLPPKTARKNENVTDATVATNGSEQEVQLQKSTREKFREKLRNKKLEDKIVEISVNERPMIFQGIVAGGEELGVDFQNILEQMVPAKSQVKKVTISEARRILMQEEAEKAIDKDKVMKEAIDRTENYGIIFIDEIDKVASKEGSQGPDVSREGVQRDLLPIVEGSTVVTRYGMVKSDRILFIAAGAFHVSKPSDLIPELQGRFPIRVELNPLGKEDFKRILTEPKNALIKQYVALLKTEGVNISFEDDGIEEITELAVQVNTKMQNIGARRLHTIMEKLLEEVSFAAPDESLNDIKIDEAYVKDKLHDISKDEDLSRYIL